ncbi:hypothetical protein JCM5353_003080 [Sporobolomyces roseus]
MPDSLFGDSDSEEDALDHPAASTNSISPPRSSFANVLDSTSMKEALSKGFTAMERCQDSFQITSPPPLIATSHLPPIPGLFLFPNAVPPSLQHSLTLSLSSTIFPAASNQVMLFDSPSHSSLPSFLVPLLDLLPAILDPLPDEVKRKLFDENRPRQCIMNLYREGEGISPHVDLPERYTDGIVGISLLSSTVMDFVPVEGEDGGDQSGGGGEKEKNSHSVRLRPGSVYVLSGDARYRYTHGIAYRNEDVATTLTPLPIGSQIGPQIGSQLVDWTDPQKAVATEGVKPDDTIQLDLAISMTKALHKSEESASRLEVILSDLEGSEAVAAVEAFVDRCEQDGDGSTEEEGEEEDEEEGEDEGEGKGEEEEE